MEAKTYNQKLISSLAQRKDISISQYPLTYASGSYDFLKITSKKIGPDDKIFLIRAGIHGDEVSGPLTFLDHCNEIIDYAHKNGVKLIIYPLGNPSGFEEGIRYNSDNDLGSGGNNDFLRYELADGSLVDDLKNSDSFVKRYWASDVNIPLPQETILMHKLLHQDPLSQVIGILDIHQDYLTPNVGEGAYHYVFGDITKYNSIIKHIEQIIPLIKNTPIGAGFGVQVNDTGEVQGPVNNEEMLITDTYGNIIRHDGTLPDLFWRLECPFCVTVESYGATEMKKAIEVNLTWIYGMIDMITQY